jgi:hypothetical protein
MQEAMLSTPATKRVCIERYISEIHHPGIGGILAHQCQRLHV